MTSVIPELNFSYDPFDRYYKPGRGKRLGKEGMNPFGGRNYMDPNAAYRAYQRSILPEGERLDPRYLDIGRYYDDAASSTTTAIRNLRRAERNAGRLIDPTNRELIRFYANRSPREISSSAAEGIGGLFVGPAEGSQFTGQSSPMYFTGVPGRGSIPGAPVSRYSGRSGPSYSGRSGPSYTSPPEVSVSISEGIAGMMGGGLVRQRTPFRKGRAMDRMVSEMTRNISRR